MKRVLCGWAGLIVAIILSVWFGLAHAADPCDQYGRLVSRLAINVNGPAAPIPMLLGQAAQESSCNPTVTAWDNGRGFAQMMDGTSAQVSKICPQIGPPDPYSVVWSINAMICYNNWIFKRVKGKDACHKWAATLTAYNGGLGYVKQSQSASRAPDEWFDVTEAIPTRQSKHNFAYSRSYPRKILFKHQPRYAKWGQLVCPGGPK